MKSFVKSGKVSERVIGRLPVLGEAEVDGVEVMECCNLRRDALSGRLVSAGRPVRCGKLSGLPLVTWIDEAEGRVALTESGGRLRVTMLGGESAGYDAGGVSGAVKCAVKLRDDCVVVMTDVDRYILEKGAAGKWSVRPQRQYPAMQFVAADEMRLTADVEGRELSGSYTTRSIALNAADTARLGEDLLKGYAELADRATRGGMELQPLLARYRLEGKGGEVLYRSPVVQVGASTGVQCAGELHCELEEDGRRRGTLRLAADVYRLRLRQTGSSELAPGEVRRLVVETSLPVHPVDRDVTAANALGRSGTNGIMLRCFVPGASVTMVSSRRHVASQLARLAMKGDVAFHESAVINNPFDGGGPVDVTVAVNRGGVHGMDAEMAEVKRQSGMRVEAVPENVALCRVPSRFVAVSGCAAGGLAVWGGITVTGFSGYRIDEFAQKVTADDEPHSWRSVVVTELASGRRRVATSWGTQHAPLKLSPILSYPRADAVRMTVVLERDGEVYKGEFPLTADETRTAAYYCNGDCREIELEATDESFAYVSDDRVGEYKPSLLLTADADNPLDAVGAERAGSGRVVTVTGVDRRGSAWEFGEHRVYAMTTGGIYLTALDGGGSRLRCSRIDRRGVTGRGAVAETDDDKYPLVCIASGDLIGLSRGNAVTLEASAGVCAAGWDGVRKELWLSDETGCARVKQSLAGGWRTVGGLSVTGFHDTGAGLLIATDLGVRDTAAGESAMAEFGYTLRVNMPAWRWYASRSRVAAAGVDLRSGNVNGLMRVRSLTIAGKETGFGGEMEFRGEVNSPLVMGLHGCRGAVVEVSVSGEMEGEIGILNLEF